MKNKTAIQIYKNGKPDDFTAENIVEIIFNLYNKNLAEAFFIGMSWPEGFVYCSKKEYVLANYKLFLKDFRPIWFACKFLGE